MTAPSALPIEILRIENGMPIRKPDLLAAEEPLEIRLGFGPANQREQRTVAVTMRTPGHDLELALGFLFSEGIIRSMTEVTHIDHCTNNKGERTDNAVRVELIPERVLDWALIQRNFYTNSSCGICSKASIESIETMCTAPVQSSMSIDFKTVSGLSQRMREAQRVFAHTGGLHASALFDNTGNMEYMREDIGRHNALDKMIGSALFRKMLPLNQHILMLSGRSSFELVQKAVVAGIPIVAAIGAPSSLAAETARVWGVTLLGFVKDNQFNIYANEQRIVL